MLVERPFAALYPFAFALAAFLAAALSPLAARLAQRLGVVAAPRADRWHRRPTPMLGGLAIFAAIAIAFVVVPQPLQEDRYERYAYLVVGAAVVFALGLYDDLRRLPPYTKLLGQIVAACILVFGQLHLFGRPSISPVMAPFAIIWIVGVTNAFNLLDNMDGLSAGIATVVGLTLFGSSHLEGDRQSALIALIVAGAASGFLLHNFNPARIFMGDCGSLLLGYLLSGLTLLSAAQSTRGVTATLLLPVVVMALPILDTTLVAILRQANGRSIAQGGRDHLSHRLVALGLTERQAVLVLYLIAALTGLLAVGSHLLGLWPTLAIWALLMAGIVLFGVFLGQVRVYTEADFQRLDSGSVIGRMVLGGRNLLYKQQVAAMLLDLLLVMASLLAAYLLRFEGRLDPLFLSQFARMLPIAVSVKLAVFLALGVYRSVWRHMGLADAWLIVRACTLGTILTAVLFLAIFGEASLPRTVLLIDLLVLSVAMLASRRSFELMHHLVTQSRRDDVTRVLVVGAGDGGELVLRALYRSRRRAYRPVGLLDDDDRYLHRTIQGVPVLGPVSDLRAVLEERQVDEVVVALPTERQAQRVLRECEALGLPALDLASFIKAELQPGPAAVSIGS